MSKETTITPEVQEAIDRCDLSQMTVRSCRGGEENLFCEEGGYFLHSNYNPIKEMEKEFSTLSWLEMNLLYIYGVGLGYAVDAAAEWLKSSPKNQIVFLERDARVIARLAKSARGKSVLENPQVHVYILPSEPEERAKLCDECSLYFYGCKFAFAALPIYQTRYSEDYVAIQKLLHEKHAVMAAGSREFLDYGIVFFKNYFKNIIDLPKCHDGTALWGKFKGVPAIICGAGPSLDKHTETLKDIKNRAIIFAGGSSLNALLAKGIRPHFGASLDPNPQQYDRIRRQERQEIPFFFKMRMNHDAFKSLHDAKLYLPGNPGYPITSVLDQRLGIESEDIVEGYNVLHMTMDLARKMGCNPIIFVGMDLAYTGMKLYAGDVVTFSELSEEDMKREIGDENHAIVRNDIYGNPIYTLWRFVKESEFTSYYCTQFPDVTWINATEGGIGAEGVVNCDLKQVFTEHLKNQYDLRNWIHCEIEGNPLKCDTEQIQSFLKEIQEGFLNCEKQFKAIQENLKQLKIATFKRQKDKINSLSDKIKSIQKELKKEKIFTECLDLMHEYRSLLSNREFDLLDVDHPNSTRHQSILQQYDVSIEEYEWLIRGARANRILLEEVLQ